MAETKVYYSKSGGLTFWVRKPTYLHTDQGRTVTDEGPMVQFHPQSDGYGRFMTDDPELQKACEARPDVFGPEEYIRRITPVEKQLEASKREITSQNRLVADLQKRIAELEKKPGGASSPR